MINAESNGGFSPPERSVQWEVKRCEPGLVSVIIPTHNRAHLLKIAIDSIYAQTYRPIELLVVDDGSTDDTGQVIKEWRKGCADPRFEMRYLYQANKGACAARNRGITEATGEYIQFLDSDDWLKSEKTQWGVEALSADPTLALVYFRTQGVDDQGRELVDVFYGEECRNTEADVCRYMWHSSGPLFRREIVDAVGPWREDLAGSQDWEYGVRVRLLGHRALFDERVAAVARIHHGQRISVSSFNYKYTRSAERAYDHIAELARVEGRMSKQLVAGLTKLYLYRAWEYYGGAYYADTDRCLAKARSVQSSRTITWMTTVAFTYCSPRVTVPLVRRAMAIRRTIRAARSWIKNAEFAH